MEGLEEEEVHSKHHTTDPTMKHVATAQTPVL